MPVIVSHSHFLMGSLAKRNALTNACLNSCDLAIAGVGNLTRPPSRTILVESAKESHEKAPSRKNRSQLNHEGTKATKSNDDPQSSRPILCALCAFVVESDVSPRLCASARDLPGRLRLHCHFIEPAPRSPVGPTTGCCSSPASSRSSTSLKTRPSHNVTPRRLSKRPPASSPPGSAARAKSIPTSASGCRDHENGRWTPPVEVANGVQSPTLRYPDLEPGAVPVGSRAEKDKVQVPLG